MIKKYIHQVDYDKRFKDKFGNVWGYYSKKKIKEKYPNGGERAIRVVGEIVNKNCTNDSVLEYENKSLNLGIVGYHKKAINRVGGYINCGENEYIAVMKKNWLMFFIILAAILSIIIGSIYFNKINNSPKLDTNANDYVANLKKPENWEPNKIAIPGYPEIKAKEGDEFAYVALWNPEYNPVYFKFEILMNKSNEVLYETNLIPPGKAITKIPLKKGMKPGTYDITIKISSYSLNDANKSMNGANVKTKLIILKN